MKTMLPAISLLVLGVLAASGPVFAHHGNANYDTSKTVTVTGTVTEYHWANPHVWLKVEGKDESGNAGHWVIEAQNIVNQVNLGWSQSMFKPGDHVVIECTPAKNSGTFGRIERKSRIVINGQEFKAS